MKGLGSVSRRAGALALVLALSASAGAQQAASPTPWRAFLGCWSAGAVTPLALDASAPVVCVVPGNSADVVQVTTLADGKVVTSQAIDASGREVPLDAKGCAGTQTGRWSADGRRVYLNAVATCDGQLRTTSGILAMTADGEWLDVQGMKAGGTENVRVARYRDIGMRGSVPAEIAESLRNGGLSVASARIAAGADIGTTAVVEAAKATTVGVAEAFVLERGQRFSLDAGQLVALADAGVSPRLTDAMIAVSNPQTFAVNRPEPSRRDTVYEDGGGRRVYVTLDRYASPWGWGYSPYGYSGYGYGYDRYGYSGFGSGYGNGYGYPGYVYGGPVVIIRGTQPAAAHGRMVKGRGYEPPSRPAAAQADREPSRSGSPSSGTRSSGAGSGASSSGSSERTAKPRP